MAEFDFFCTRSELAALLSYVAAAGYSIQLNEPLLDMKANFCNSPEEIELALERGVGAFLLARPGMSRFPVGMIQSKKDSRRWYLYPSVGGPVLEIYYFQPFEENGQQFFPCSLISYNSKIENPQSGNIEDAGNDVKSAYRELTKKIRKSFRMVRSTKKVAYVSPGVDELIALGWRLAAPFGQ